MVTNPNCSTADWRWCSTPLADAFGLEKIFVVTMQAVSGAGYLGSFARYLRQRRAVHQRRRRKMEASRKSCWVDGMVRDSIDAGLGISAHCNRVPVRDGHLECVFARPEENASIREVEKSCVILPWTNELASLPTAVRNPIIVVDEENRHNLATTPAPSTAMGAAVVGRIRDVRCWT